MHHAIHRKVATAFPHQKLSLSSQTQNQAWDRLISMLEKGLQLGGEKFNRDELYDR
jgi:hypothetical protein